MDLLVSVSSTHYGAYTPRPINLVVYKGSHGIPYLEGAWRLDAFNAYPFPNLATRLCPWQNNRNTIGSSLRSSRTKALLSSILRPRQIGPNCLTTF